MLENPAGWKDTVKGILCSQEITPSSDLDFLLKKSEHLKYSKDPESVALLVRLIQKSYLHLVKQTSLEKPLNDRILQFCQDIVLEAPNRAVLDEVVKLWAICTAFASRTEDGSPIDALLQNWFALMRSTMAEDMVCLK